MGYGHHIWRAGLVKGNKYVQTNLKGTDDVIMVRSSGHKRTLQVHILKNCGHLRGVFRT